MEFRQIRYALSVAKERSSTNAAKRLNISQSAVSEQVRDKIRGERGAPFAMIDRGPGYDVMQRGEAKPQMRPGF